MAKQARSLSGKVAVVTGAARGAGLGTAKALAREGARVALGDLDQAATERAAEEVGNGAIGMRLDVADRAGFTQFLDEVERRLGPIDILVNNAGIMPVGLFEEETEQTAQRQIDVNLHAVIHSTKEAVRRMKPRHTGHIVNVASGAGWVAGAGGATYCATKFGVVGLSESLMLELHGTGVDISVVAPAVIKTEMSKGLTEVKGLRAVTPDEVGAAIVDGLKHPRFAIFVPKTMGVMAFAYTSLPYRARGFLARITNSDKLLLNVDKDARAAYESGVMGAGGTLDKTPAAPTNGGGKAAPAKAEKTS